MKSSESYTSQTDTKKKKLYSKKDFTVYYQIIMVTNNSNCYNYQGF